MRFQVTLRLFLLAFLLAKVRAEKIPLPKPTPPNNRFDCEEEVWEEISCEEILTTTLTPPTAILSTPTTLPTNLTIPTTTMIKTTTPAATTTTKTIPTTPTTALPLPPITPYRKPYPSTPIAKRQRIYASRQYPATPSRSPITPSTSATTTIAPSTTPSIESIDSYKKCYCECKSGCKEFCRKTVVNSDPKKQIIQLAKTTQPLEYGQVETKHFLERNWIPSLQPYNPSSIAMQPVPNHDQPDQHPALLQPPPQSPQLPPPDSVERNSIPASHQYGPDPYNDANIQHHIPETGSLGISIDELRKLLNSDHAYENMIPEISQPPSQYQNLYASPILPINPAALPYPYSGRVGYSDGSAAGSSPISNEYNRASYEKNDETPSHYSHPSLSLKTAIEPEYPAPQPAPSPYEDTSSSERNAPAEVSGLENYLRNLIYSHPSKERGYGYSLNF